MYSRRYNGNTVSTQPFTLLTSGFLAWGASKQAYLNQINISQILFEAKRCRFGIIIAFPMISFFGSSVPLIPHPHLPPKANLSALGRLFRLFGSPSPLLLPAKQPF